MAHYTGRYIPDWIRLTGLDAGKSLPAEVNIRIGQYTRHGILIAIYNSTAIAAEKTGVKLHSIQACISGKNKTGAGYQWRKVK